MGNKARYPFLPCLLPSPGQGLRGGVGWLLSKPLCQRGHLPAPGWGQGQFQVSSLWRPMEFGHWDGSIL